MIRLFSDIIWQFKLWYGFKYLGWYRPYGYDYGYFDKRDNTVVYMFRRDIDGKVHKVVKMLWGGVNTE